MLENRAHRGGINPEPRPPSLVYTLRAHEPVLGEKRLLALIDEYLGKGLSPRDAAVRVSNVASLYEGHRAAHMAKTDIGTTLGAIKNQISGLKEVFDWMKRETTIRTVTIEQHLQSLEEMENKLQDSVDRMDRSIVNSDKHLLPEDQGHQK